MEHPYLVTAAFCFGIPFLISLICFIVFEPPKEAANFFFPFFILSVIGFIVFLTIAAGISTTINEQKRNQHQQSIQFLMNRDGYTSIIATENTSITICPSKNAIPFEIVANNKGIFTKGIGCLENQTYKFLPVPS